MSNISGIGSNSAMMMQGMRPRPTSAQTEQMANDLFAKLDTSGQGYLTKTDLQSALDGTSSATSSASSSADALFSKLDNDGDGKVTKQEFSATLKQVAEQLDNQAMSLRMNGGMPAGAAPGGGMSGMMGGGMPPPGAMPPGGMTKDQLSSAASDASSTDSAASSGLTNLVNNFDTADTDGDGKISLKEAVAYDQKNAAATAGSASPSTSSGSSANGTAASGSDANVKVMAQIMKLMQAYGVGADQSGSLLQTLSVSA